jgi:hypothetical protein
MQRLAANADGMGNDDCQDEGDDINTAFAGRTQAWGGGGVLFELGGTLQVGDVAIIHSRCVLAQWSGHSWGSCGTVPPAGPVPVPPPGLHGIRVCAHNSGDPW